MAKREASALTIEKQNEINQAYPQVDHPRHYNTPVLAASRPSLAALGFTEQEMENTECIVALEDLFGPTVLYRFCVMNAAKYLWRAGVKGDAQTDYQKARWCLKYAQQLEAAEISDEQHRRIQHALRLLP